MEKSVLARGKIRQFLLVILGIVIGLSAGTLILVGLDPSWLLNQPEGSSGSQPVIPEVNQAAPDFALTTLTGESVRLSELKGRVVAVNFWATWCGPCRLEMPLLQTYADRYPQDLTVLAVNDAEPIEKVQPYVDDLGLSFPILLDEKELVTRLYRVRGFPTTIFIDRDGKIRYQHLGLLMEDQLRGYLTELGIEE
ncbi:MAG: hypothetical protein H6Q38_1987 [Chloroflexi bacterium]|jgi:thiol-disulfide isomerase/thioredoxin|nr:hypothetical protein [Chloroflexota bacterium]